MCGIKQFFLMISLHAHYVFIKFDTFISPLFCYSSSSSSNRMFFVSYCYSFFNSWEIARNQSTNWLDSIDKIERWTSFLFAPCSFFVVVFVVVLVVQYNSCYIASPCLEFKSTSSKKYVWSSKFYVALNFLIRIAVWFSSFFLLHTPQRYRRKERICGIDVVEIGESFGFTFTVFLFLLF